MNGKKKILVTGGAGILGRHLVQRLLEQELHVRILSRRQIDPSSLWDTHGSALQVIIGDIRHSDDVEAAVSGVDIVIHLAAAMSGTRDAHIQATINGTRNILDACCAHGVSKLIYASTLNVYHATAYKPDVTIDESFAYEPHPEKRGLYTSTKLAAEKAVIDAAVKSPDMSIVIFRPGLIYGPGYPLLLHDLGYRIGKLILRITPNERRLPLVYVSDVVEAFFKALISNMTGLHIFNLVAHECPTAREYLDTYNQISGRKVHLLQLPHWMTSLLISLAELPTILHQDNLFKLAYRYKALSTSPIFSTDAAAEVLDWLPKTGLQEGISNTLRDLTQK